MNTESRTASLGISGRYVPTVAVKSHHTRDGADDQAANWMSVFRWRRRSVDT